MSCKEVIIPTSDGYQLRGTFFSTDETHHSLVIINGATGVLRRYYQPFAEYLREQGFSVLTYDFRGIGESTQRQKDAPAPTMLDWGQVDMNAVLSWAKDNHPDKTIRGVGHSIGGQLLGVLPDNNRYHSFLGIASQHIYWRYWPTVMSRLKILAFFRGVLPLFYKTTGTLPSWVLGSETLPKKVAMDWSRFSCKSSYLADEQGQSVRTGFDNFQGRLRLCAIDDDHMFAPESCVRELGKLYKNITPQIRVIKPDEFGMRSIDHFGFFKKQMDRRAWQEAAEWLRSDDIKI